MAISLKVLVSNKLVCGVIVKAGATLKPLVPIVSGAINFQLTALRAGADAAHHPLLGTLRCNFHVLYTWCRIHRPVLESTSITASHAAAAPNLPRTDLS